MERRLICIDNDNVELSIYKEDQLTDFDFQIFTYGGDVEFKLSKKDALDITNAITQSLKKNTVTIDIEYYNDLERIATNAHLMVEEIERLRRK